MRFLGLAACGGSENTALRERVAALEKALEAQRMAMTEWVMPQAGQSMPKQEVWARSFVLVDENGKARATNAGLAIGQLGGHIGLQAEKLQARAKKKGKVGDAK